MSLDQNGKHFMYASLTTISTILFTGLTIDNFSVGTLALAITSATIAIYQWINFLKTK